MKKQYKYVTTFLKDNQYLKIVDFGLERNHCIGFTDEKRDILLDGWYLKTDLINIGHEQ